MRGVTRNCRQCSHISSGLRTYHFARNWRNAAVRPVHAIFSSSTGSISLAAHGYVYRVIVKTGNTSAIKPAINPQENPLLSSATPLDSWY
jgi:hypothetical protein